MNCVVCALTSALLISGYVQMYSATRAGHWTHDLMRPQIMRYNCAFDREWRRSNAQLYLVISVSWGREFDVRLWRPSTFVRSQRTAARLSARKPHSSSLNINRSQPLEFFIFRLNNVWEEQMITTSQYVQGHRESPLYSATSKDLGTSHPQIKRV